MHIKMFEDAVLDSKNAAIQNELKRIIELIQGSNIRSTVSIFDVKKDYNNILRHFLNNKNLELIKIIVSHGFIKQIVGECALSCISEMQIDYYYEEQLNVLCSLMRKKKEVEPVKLLLQFLNFQKLDINKKFTMPEITLPRGTLVQRALRNGWLEIVKLLVENKASLQAIDALGNSCLHYAAMGGKDTYDYVVLHGLKPSKNIFMHYPEDYLSSNKPVRENQNAFIIKFIKYIDILKKSYEKLSDLNDNQRDHYAKWIEECNDLIKNLPDGICHGDGFIKAINILRGKDSPRLHNEMGQLILAWDENESSLDTEVQSVELLKEFSTPGHKAKVKNIFEYILSIVNFCQEDSEKLLHIDMDDRVQQFNFITNREDRLIQMDMVDMDGMMKRDLDTHSATLQKLSRKNGLIEITVISQIPDAQYGHGLTLVTDSNNILHFIDPNLEYEIPGMPAIPESFDKIATLIFSYYNSVERIRAYRYEECDETKQCKKMGHF